MLHCQIFQVRPWEISSYSRNFDGFNTFGTIKICLRQGLFKLMSVNHSARSGGIIGISFLFFST